MHQIENGIYYEDAYSGVTLGAIILSQGTILIDAPLRGEDARSWRATLVNIGSSANRVLVSLDAHPDRTLGTRAMDTTMVAHHKTALTFRNRPTIFKGQNQDSGAEWEMNDEVIGTRWSTPDITFTQQLAKVIFVGDAIMPNQPPFLAHADLPAWIESLDLMLSSYRDYTIICGRGGPVGVEVVRAQKSYLTKILKGLERLAKRKAAPEMTEGLISGLIKDLSLPPKLQEHYVQRLRNGLYQYYSRHYPRGETSEEE
jgi:glyoxylase-like metal-dependent hydrolase (beta-lactamase superfamily II)